MGRAIYQWVVTGMEQRISSVAFSPCGGYVASGGASDEHVYLWSLDKPSGTPLKIENAHKERCCVVWTGDAEIATGGNDGCVAVWDVREGP